MTTFTTFTNTTKPPGLITFGSDTPCNLNTCPVEWSIYGYRPSLAANVVFTALFGIACAVHLFLGFRWKAWGFTIPMLIGCVTEIIGYVGRIILWNNPFSFNGFMVQIGMLLCENSPSPFSRSCWLTGVSL